jgi:hypothetical protein
LLHRQKTQLSVLHKKESKELPCPTHHEIHGRRGHNGDAIRHDFYDLCKSAFIKRHHPSGNPDDWKMALEYLKTKSKFKSYKERMEADGNEAQNSSIGR